jgi:hypothetical protein
MALRVWEDADDERTGRVVPDPDASRFSLPFGVVPAHQGEHRVAVKEAVALRECEAARKLVMKRKPSAGTSWLES